MKSSFTIIVLFVQVALCNLAYAWQFSMSPSAIAKSEHILRESVKWQTGCTIPDLHNSKTAGKAALNIFLNTDGSTKKIEIEQSSGTEEQNKLIITALSNCRFFNNKDNIYRFPSYFYKTLTYAWPVGDNRPKIGLKRCLLIPEYPAAARAARLEGKVTWGVRPLDNNQFEKRLLLDSNVSILNRNLERAVDKCLENPDIAQSIRDNFKNGAWDELSLNYQMQPREKK